MYTSLAQILGGTFGIAVAYAMYYFVKKRDQHREAEIWILHLAEIAKIKAQMPKKKP